MGTPRVLYLSGWPIGAHGEGAVSFVYEQIAVLAQDLDAVYAEHRFASALDWARRRTTHHDVEPIADLWPEHVMARRVWTTRWSPRLTRRDLLDDVWHAGAAVASRVVRACGPIDLVHAHVVLPAGCLGAAVAETLGVPFVLQEHSAPFSMHLDTAAKRAAVQRTLRSARAICAVGDTLAQRIAEEAPDISPVRVLPNLVATDVFVARRFPPDRDVLRIVSVGALEARKGFDVLLSALRILGNSTGQRVSLQLVGEGSMRADIASQLRSMGHEPAATLTGPLTRSQTAAAMAAAHLYVCASRHETFGLAPAEALAVGRPVVSTRCGGPEAFVDEACGELVTPDDPQELAEAIHRTWNRLDTFDPARLHARIEARYGPDAFRRRVLDLYDELLYRRAAA